MKTILMNAIHIKALSTAFFLLINASVFAQDQEKVSADLDGDGKKDSFWIKGDKLQYQLSTQKNAIKSSRSVDIEGRTNSLTVAKNVVTLSASAMRSGNVYRFRYEKAANDFRVIGYESENFGNAANDGSGKSSYNLLTGDYVANWNHWVPEKESLIALPEIRKKVPAKKYYLTSFDDKVMEELSAVDYDLLPAVLK